MTRWWERVPLLLASAALLLTGAADEEVAGTQMLAAGFVVLGTWVGVEAKTHLRQSEPEHHEDDPPGAPPRKP